METKLNAVVVVVEVEPLSSIEPTTSQPSGSPWMPMDQHQSPDFRLQTGKYEVMGPSMIFANSDSTLRIICQLTICTWWKWCFFALQHWLNNEKNSEFLRQKRFFFAHNFFCPNFGKNKPF